MDKQLKKMSFFEHLNELRSRIIISISFIMFFAILSYIYSDKIIDFLMRPAKEYFVDFQIIKITSIFLIKIGLSIVSGIICSFPFIFFQFLKFITPAFQRMSTIKIFTLAIVSLLLFLVGIVFGYTVIIPISISFFTNLTLGIDSLMLNYTLDSYLIYILWVLIISSAIFQLPFVIFIIVKSKLIDINSLQMHRKHIIVFFFIIAALLTPPDPLSQLLIVIPLYLLFELSIVLAKIF